MSDVRRFFFKYCRSGHMLYADDGPPVRPRCETCGEEYLEKCPECQTTLQNVFASYVYFTNGRPISFPKRPDYCRHCGKPMPWLNKEVRRVEASGLWALIHPAVAELAKPRFEAGHYADAVEAVFKELNARVKEIYKRATGEELDGVPLMRKAFAPSKPTIVFEDLGSDSGRNVQQGYLDLFAGAMAGIRNPKAHGNIVITAERASHHLVLASLLFHRLDESQVRKGEE